MRVAYRAGRLHLYEVQRPKRQADLAAIAATFQPYLEARDWVTIQKETP